ncbi:hypothetical protein O3I_003985 [Nocardia brasiliensis ATCC 700358]|uniref:Uncharacterized protein n=1 Tax=Nocardia brasiliensis (strain ATCC 700358 / HUJEG-1) TaxID=1133849 RepID=K0EPK8_NOCB7|nr:hypothetical protein O3I_003985 [Nocardia brasiliensis ATCC 700358]
MDGRARTPVEPAFAGEYLPDLLLLAQSPHPIFTRTDAAITELVGDEAVAERGVVGMDAEGSIDQMGIIPITL